MPNSDSHVLEDRLSISHPAPPRCGSLLLSISADVSSTDDVIAFEGLYIDSFSQDFKTAASYRGQNANMHMCEAMIGLYDSTNDPKYLLRAAAVAKKLCVELAPMPGRVIEHYGREWKPDAEKNKDADPSSEEYIFRPYGFQVSTAQHSTAQHSTAQHSTAHSARRVHVAGRCAALRCAALRCAALRCAALRCAALHCTALHCSTELKCLALYVSLEPIDMFLSRINILYIQVHTTSTHTPTHI